MDFHPGDSEIEVEGQSRRKESRLSSRVTPSRIITHIGIMIVIFEGMLARLQ
jgi:hypothetical protein